MYRYSIDNAITYTSEDLVLFKESPFACWMERLTLENPNHAIPPDVGSSAPADSMESQADLADTLRDEGKNVTLVDWDQTEPVRRSRTLEAMRQGVDYIVDGQLALGTLSCSTNLLIRTSGYSELGNYLYVPCSTQPKTNLHSALRLCFIADLLHSLQGQLPPQMLIIRGDSDIVPLQTEDHIYHYRAVKQRFMAVQGAFRKHKMPDPAESSHFGRWADCANEVLKQRALRQGMEPDSEEEIELPALSRPLGLQAAASAYDLDDVEIQRRKAEGTLVEQARHLSPMAVPEPDVVDTLQNLAFIGGADGYPADGAASVRAPSAGAKTRQHDAQPLRDAPEDIEEAEDSVNPVLEFSEPLEALDRAANEEPAGTEQHPDPIILPVHEQEMASPVAANQPMEEDYPAHWDEEMPVVTPRALSWEFIRESGWVSESETEQGRTAEPVPLDAQGWPLADEPDFASSAVDAPPPNLRAPEVVETRGAVNSTATVIQRAALQQGAFSRRTADNQLEEESAPSVEESVQAPDSAADNLDSRPHPLDSPDFQRASSSFVDMDATPLSSLAEAPNEPVQELGDSSSAKTNHDVVSVDATDSDRVVTGSGEKASLSPFSNSLITDSIYSE